MITSKPLIKGSKNFLRPKNFPRPTTSRESPFPFSLFFPFPSFSFLFLLFPSLSYVLGMQSQVWFHSTSKSWIGLWKFQISGSSPGFAACSDLAPHAPQEVKPSLARRNEPSGGHPVRTLRSLTHAAQLDRRDALALTPLLSSRRSPHAALLMPPLQ